MAAWREWYVPDLSVDKNGIRTLDPIGFCVTWPKYIIVITKPYEIDTLSVKCLLCSIVFIIAIILQMLNGHLKFNKYSLQCKIHTILITDHWSAMRWIIINGNRFAKKKKQQIKRKKWEEENRNKHTLCSVHRNQIESFQL